MPTTPSLQDIFSNELEIISQAERLRDTLTDITGIYASHIHTMGGLNNLQKKLTDSAKDFSATTLKTFDFEGNRHRVNASLLAQYDLMHEQQKKALVYHEEALQLSDKLADSMFGIIEKIPVAGKLLSDAMGLDTIKEEFSKKITANFRNAMMGNANTFASAVDIMKKYISSMGGAIKNLVTNPMMIMLILVVAAVDRWRQLDKAAEDFRRTTGLTADLTKDIEKTARFASREYADFGVTIESVYKSAAALADVFEVSKLVTKDLIETTSLLAANLGVSEEASAKTIQNFRQLSGLSETQAANLTIATTQLARAAVVAPNKVMQDIANASETTLAMVRGSAVELAKGAVEARRMGTSINAIAESARNMLNFQDSMNAEMEASTLLGKNLTFQASRQAAFEGDAVKARKLAIEQLKSVGDISTLNVFQQEALAKAAGMTVGEMQKQLQRERDLNKLRQTDLAAYNEYTRLEKELSGAKDRNMKSELLQMKMQSQQAQMINQLKKIWVEISDVLVPIVDIAAKILVPTLRIISALVSGILSPVIFVSDRIDEIIDGVESTLGLSNGLLSTLKDIGIAVSVIVGLYGIWRLYNKMLIAGTSSGIDDAAKKITRLTGHISKFVGGIGKGIGNFIQGIFRGIANGLTSFSKIPWGGILKGVVAVGLLGASLWLLSIPLKTFAEIDWAKVLIGAGVISLFALAVGGLGLAAQFILFGAAALAGLGLALMILVGPLEKLSKVDLSKLLGDLTKSAFEFSKILPSLAVGIFGLGAAFAYLGFMMPAILVGVVALGLMTIALQRLDPVAKSLGESFKSIAEGISSINIATLSSISSMAQAVNDMSAIKLGMLLSASVANASINTLGTISNGGISRSKTEKEMPTSDISQKLDRIIELFESGKIRTYISKKDILATTSVQR